MFITNPAKFGYFQGLNRRFKVSLVTITFKKIVPSILNGLTGEILTKTSAELR